MESFINCGVNVFYPMEPAAGMDIVRMREKFGRGIYYKGGIDKHILREGKEAIKNELKYKLSPLMQEGGCVFGLDHRIPNGTPLESYRYYIDTARDILNLPPRNKDEKGWQRMAF
jgi:uroporphyrinogen decarboxylase